MENGSIVSIIVGTEAAGPLSAVESVRAEAGRGLEGDRYYLRQGTFWKAKPDFEVTLIESESLEALAAEFGIELDPREARRNLVTRGVRLNDLVGRRFRVGEAIVEGIRLCEPCGHLERLTGNTLRPQLSGRGGLRASIAVSGAIRVGDIVEVEAAVPAETVEVLA